MKSKLLSAALVSGALTAGVFHAQAQGFTQNFDDITTLSGNGWFMQNNSSPLGVTSWFQGTSVAGGGPFDAYNGAAAAYIGANFNNTGSAGTISNWLLTPVATIKNGDVISFYTRSTGDNYPDRLQLRLSTNGASSNVGSTATDVGDFTTVLTEVNPTLVVGGYPATWTQYTVTVSGLSAPVSGRFAFRYFVTSAGSSGSNSDYIGIDNVIYTPYVCPTFALTADGALTGGNAGIAYTYGLTQSGALGTPAFAVTSGALPPGVTLAANGTISGTPTATGNFTFSVTVSDASGCSGSGNYSIQVDCAANPIAFSDFSGCSNDGLITLAASPAGGTYSGTGVTAGQFDPSSGSQMLTYDYTDPYGCAYSQTATVTVNPAPVADLGADVSECADAYVLTTMSDPDYGYTWNVPGTADTLSVMTSGTYSVTVTSNTTGCSNSDTVEIMLHPDPSVTMNLPDMICEYNIALIMNGTPAGGTYFGSTAISGNMFDPALSGSGTFTIEYMYTDVNGCSAIAIDTIAVSECLGIQEQLFETGFALYPNPADALVNISISNTYEHVLLELISATGKVLFSKEVTVSGELVETLDISDYSNGIYYLRLTNSGGSAIEKLVKN